MVMLSSIGFEIRCCAIWAAWFTVWHTLSKFSARGRRNDRAKVAVNVHGLTLTECGGDGLYIDGDGPLHTQIKYGSRNVFIADVH